MAEITKDDFFCLPKEGLGHDLCSSTQVRPMAHDKRGKHDTSNQPYIAMDISFKQLLTFRLTIDIAGYYLALIYLI